MCIDRPPHSLSPISIPPPFNRCWAVKVARGTPERRKSRWGREETGTVDPAQQYNLKRKVTVLLNPPCLSTLKESVHLHNMASGWINSALRETPTLNPTPSPCKSCAMTRHFFSFPKKRKTKQKFNNIYTSCINGRYTRNSNSKQTCLWQDMYNWMKHLLLSGKLRNSHSPAHSNWKQQLQAAKRQKWTGRNHPVDTVGPGLLFCHSDVTRW